MRKWWLRSLWTFFVVFSLLSAALLTLQDEFRQIDVVRRNQTPASIIRGGAAEIE